MEELVKKLENYNIFNFLLPGILSVLFLEEFLPFDVTQDDLLIDFFIYYFVGLVISRIGALIIEPVFKRLKIVKFVDYSKFLKARKADEKIDILSQENNMYRTLVSLMFCGVLAVLYSKLLQEHAFVQKHSELILLCSAGLLFAVAYAKQTAYIVNRVQHTVKSK